MTTRYGPTPSADEPVSAFQDSGRRQSTDLNLDGLPTLQELASGHVAMAANVPPIAFPTVAAELRELVKRERDDAYHCGCVDSEETRLDAYEDGALGRDECYDQRFKAGLERGQSETLCLPAWAKPVMRDVLELGRRWCSAGYDSFVEQAVKLAQLSDSLTKAQREEIEHE